MSKSTTVVTSSSSGVGFLGLLAVAFIVLKLLGVIDWPWLWVLAPIWIPLAIFLVIVVIFVVAFVIYCLVTR